MTLARSSSRLIQRMLVLTPLEFLELHRELLANREYDTAEKLRQSVSIDLWITQIIGDNALRTFREHRLRHSIAPC